ncbi:XRE family transcriptional regulator [Microbispora bryophytorum]|uniref:XRE family transcriptional regulator n=1 Tax=Microbispora bryophytorum TaxID=1460882 RepID=UPI0033EA5F01
MIYGERVRQLREMHRMTQAQLVGEVPGLTQPQLSRIEKGQAEPNEETVALFAAIFGVTVDLFQRPPISSLSAHSPQLRARSRLTARDKSSSLEWARLIEEEYQRLQEQARTLPVRISASSQASPSDAARQMREVLGFNPKDPLPYLILAVERIGITVLGIPMRHDALDAFCAWREEKPIIAVLSDVPGDRIRFNVAHELGHLVLHGRRQTGRDMEAEADEFAAELLAPLESIRREMPRRPTLSSLAMLKTQWGVSIKSLIRRARELDLIDQDRAISLYKQISARGWNRAEPGHVPIEKPRALRKLAEIVYGPGPNIEKMSYDAGWSEELTFEVLKQHATLDELPYQGPRHLTPIESDSHNVLPFRR